MFNHSFWTLVFSWFVSVLLLLLAVYSGKIAFMFLIGCLTCMSIGDYTKLLCLPYFFYKVMIFNVFVSFFVVTVLPTHFGALPFVFFMLTIFLSAQRNKMENTLSYTSLTLFGSIWLIFSMFHFIRIGSLPFGSTHLIGIGFAIACSDVVAFLVGPFIGHVVGAFFGLGLVPHFSTKHSLILGAVIGISVMIGDLTLKTFKQYVRLSDDKGGFLIETSKLGRASKILIPAVTAYWTILMISR